MTAVWGRTWLFLFLHSYFYKMRSKLTWLQDKVLCCSDTEVILLVSSFLCFADRSGHTRKQSKLNQKISELKAKIQITENNPVNKQ